LRQLVGSKLLNIVFKIGIFGDARSGKSCVANSIVKLLLEDYHLERFLVGGTNERMTLNVMSVEDIENLHIYDFPGVRFHIDEWTFGVLSDALNKGLPPGIRHDDFKTKNYVTDEKHKLDFAIIVIDGLVAWENGRLNTEYFTPYRRIYEDFPTKVYFIITKKDMINDLPDTIEIPRIPENRTKFLTLYTTENSGVFSKILETELALLSMLYNIK